MCEVKSNIWAYDNFSRTCIIFQVKIDQVKTSSIPLYKMNIFTSSLTPYILSVFWAVLSLSKPFYFLWEVVKAAVLHRSWASFFQMVDFSKFIS